MRCFSYPFLGMANITWLQPFSCNQHATNMQPSFCISDGKSSIFAPFFDYRAIFEVSKPQAISVKCH